MPSARTLRQALGRGNQIVFGFSKVEKIGKAYARLNERMYGAGKKAEAVFERRDIEQLLALSGEPNTAAEMLFLSYQADLMSRFAEKCPYPEIAQELCDLAKNRGEATDSAVVQEGTDHYETAKAYCEEITSMLSSGLMRDSQPVREFCADKATILLASSALYRARLLSAYRQLSSGNEP